MTSKPDPGREIGEGYKLLGVGLQFAGGIILFMVGGYALDRWLGITPVLTLVGTLVGAVLSFINLYARISTLTEKDRERRKEKHPK